VDEILIGMADADSGINVSSLSVTADISIAGQQPGDELAGLVTPVDQGIYHIPLSASLPAATNAHLLVSVRDNQGNIARVRRQFSVGSGGPVPSPTTPRPTWTPALTPTPTPTPLVTHDSAVLPHPRPVRVRLRKGALSRLLRLRVGVRNMDTTPGDVHDIQLVAESGTCPPGVLQGLPDFALRQTGDQDHILVPRGRRKNATVRLLIQRDSFTSPDARTPATCLLHFTAVSPGIDPTPENNSIDVQLLVIDGNDF